MAFANSDPPDRELLKDSILWYLPWPVRCELLFFSFKPGKILIKRSGYIKYLMEKPAFANVRKSHGAVKDILRWLVEGDAYSQKDGVLALINFSIVETKLAMKLVRTIPETYDPDSPFPFPRNMSPDDYEQFVEEAQNFYGLRPGIKGERKTSPIGRMVPTKEYSQILAPVVDFMTGQFEKIRQDGSRIPVFICEHCNKFFVAAKVRKTVKNRFCSPPCKSADRRKSEPANKGTYDQWLRRAWRKGKKRREYMSRQENIDRLSAIEACDKLGPACQRMVERLKMFLPPHQANTA